MPLSFLQYDVFTREPLAGNQLAVFLDGRGLSEAQMQAIAREMNFSESTFILPAEMPGTDVRMRIFTPDNELPMAGHPTIGTTFALARAGRISPGASRFVFGLGVGPTPVDLRWQGERLAFAEMTQRNPRFAGPIPDRASAAAAIGLTGSDLVDDLPVQQVDCGVPFLLLPLRDRETVDRAAIDEASYHRLIDAHRLDSEMPLYLFALDRTAGEAYARMFAPGFGIAEDPATGSAAGPLGSYVVQHGLLGPATTNPQPITNLEILQGVKMKRPSRMHVAITGVAGAITSVRVGGEAVLVGEGELFV